MGLEVYFDQSGTNNTVKIDPNANTVRATVTPTPPTYYYTRNVIGQIPPPFTKDKLVCSTPILDPGWYEIQWMIGLAGRAANVGAGMASNMRLKIGGMGYRGIYDNSDKAMSMTMQPKITIQVTGNNDSAQILVVDEDKVMTSATDQFYCGVINATRIA